MTDRDVSRMRSLLKNSIRASHEAIALLDEMAGGSEPRPFRPVSPDRDSRSVNFYPPGIPNSGFEKPSRANRRHKRRWN